MVCLIELSSHLINASAFDSENVSEMRLAARLTDKTPDNSITLFDIAGTASPLAERWRELALAAATEKEHTV